MARTNSPEVGQPTTRKRKRRRNMSRQTTGGTRSGAATGGMPGTASMPVNYDALSAHIRGTVDGFALANNITSQQAFSGLKKALVW
jgi:hypothetical protein